MNRRAFLRDLLCVAAGAVSASVGCATAYTLKQRLPKKENPDCWADVDHLWKPSDADIDWSKIEPGPMVIYTVVAVDRETKTVTIEGRRA